MNCRAAFFAYAFQVNRLRDSCSQAIGAEYRRTLTVKVKLNANT